MGSPKNNTTTDDLDDLDDTDEQAKTKVKPVKERPNDLTEGNSQITRWRRRQRASRTRPRGPEGRPHDCKAKRQSIALAVFDYDLDAEDEKIGESGPERPRALVTGPRWTGSLDEPTFKQAMEGEDREKWLRDGERRQRYAYRLYDYSSRSSPPDPTAASSNSTSPKRT